MTTVERLKLDILENFGSSTVNKVTDENINLILGNVNMKILLNDKELIDTITALFQNNLNVSVASKSGFMHRNTFLYRIDKIKRLIGIDIRKFCEACALKNLLSFAGVNIN